MYIYIYKYIYIYIIIYIYMYFFTFHSFTPSFTLFTFAPFISLFDKKHHPILTVVWELLSSPLDHPKKKIGSKPTGSSLVVQTWFPRLQNAPIFSLVEFFSTTLNQLNEPGKLQKRGKEKSPLQRFFFTYTQANWPEIFVWPIFFAGMQKMSSAFVSSVTLWSPDLC